MTVTIGLARFDYEGLLRTVTREDVAYPVLRRCSAFYRLPDQKPSMCVIIECERDEALALLQAAKQHCLAAVPDIEYGLERART